MNATEALQICRLAKAASPAQAVDEYTPDLWAMVLEPVRFADARDAVVQLAAEQEWIHVSHIVKRVKLIRSERIRAFGPFAPPTEIDRAVADGNQQAYLDWYAATIKAIGDGDLKPSDSPGLIEKYGDPTPIAIPPNPGHADRLDALLAGDQIGAYMAEGDQ